MVQLWFDKHKSAIRRAFLMVFIVSIFGPWGFDRHSVPADIPCDFRLYGDFCGTPIPAVGGIFMSLSIFFQSISDLSRHTLLYNERLLNGLWLLNLFPIFTTIIILWIRETRFIRTINLIAWILAFISTLTAFILLFLKIKGLVFWLFGLWLYILLAISVVVIEFIMMNNKPLKNS